MVEHLTPSDLVRDDEVFLRMNLAERIQHVLLIVTFTTLILTGLPLVFYELKIFKSLFAWEKAFYVRGLVHRAVAVLMIANMVWHLATRCSPRAAGATSRR